MFRLSWLPEFIARAFVPPPPEEIWRWAESEVWLENKAAAEPGPYRSAKTPWTRRLQEIGKRAIMLVWDFDAAKWVAVRVSEFSVMKCSQSGFSEACLNIVRWCAKFRPCNVIYAIDTREEAKEICERLLPTLRRLDPTGDSIFSDDDDDIGTLVLRLLAMNVWFFGSFSTGKFANKQSPLVLVDEKEEHAIMKGDTSSGRNLASRKKTAPNGLQVNLSKPKRKNGPIHKDHKRGNQELFMVTCPHCGHRQPLTFFSEEIETPFTADLVDVNDDQTGELIGRMPIPLPRGQTRKIKTGRIVFDHCRDPDTKEWDRLKVQRETYYECAGPLKCRIDEFEKSLLLEGAQWVPTVHGSPGIISQQINDLYSMDVASAWGVIALDFIDANREGRKELQGFYNHRCGTPFSEAANKTTPETIKRNIAGNTENDECLPYHRGLIPFVPQWIVLGGDVGLTYAKWAVGAVSKNLRDIAVFDWGAEIDPSEIATIMSKLNWECRDWEKRLPISVGFLDAKYRKDDAYNACLAIPGRKLIPTAGLGGATARGTRAWTYSKMPTYGGRLHLLTYNDFDSKNALYIDALKEQKRRIWFPTDVSTDLEFVKEMCAEEMKEDDSGVMKWDEHPGANHYGDCVKDILNGVRFLTREHQRGSGSEEPSESSG